MNNSHILVSSKKFHNRNRNLLGTFSLKHEEKISVFSVRLGMSSFHSLAAHALHSEEWQPGRAFPSSCTGARLAPWQRGISPVAAHNKFEGTGCLPDGWCYPFGEHVCLTVQGCLQLRFTPVEGRSFPLCWGYLCVPRGQ